MAQKKPQASKPNPLWSIKNMIQLDPELMPIEQSHVQ
jgi:hypothetical protein